MGKVSYKGEGKYTCTNGDTVTEFVYESGVNRDELYDFINECKNSGGTLKEPSRFKKKESKKYSNIEGDDIKIADDPNKKIKNIIIPPLTGGILGASAYIISKNLKLSREKITIITMLGFAIGLGLGMVYNKKTNKK